MGTFDELGRPIINSGNPGQSGTLDELGRLLVTDPNKSTGTGGDAPGATTTTAGVVRAATATESEQASGKINLAWSINKLRALFATALPDLRALFATALPDWVKTAATLIPNDRFAPGAPTAGHVMAATTDSREWIRPRLAAPIPLADVSPPAAITNGTLRSIPLSQAVTAGMLIEIVFEDGDFPTNWCGMPLIPAATLLRLEVKAGGTGNQRTNHTLSYEVHRGTAGGGVTTGFSHSTAYIGMTDANNMIVGHSHWDQFDRANLQVKVYAH